MSSLDDPINVVRNVGKKLIPVAGFQILENIANLRQIRWHWRLLSLSGFFVNRWVNIYPESLIGALGRSHRTLLPPSTQRNRYRGRVTARLALPRHPSPD